MQNPTDHYFWSSNSRFFSPVRVRVYDVLHVQISAEQKASAFACNPLTDVGFCLAEGHCSLTPHASPSFNRVCSLESRSV